MSWRYCSGVGGTVGEGVAITVWIIVSVVVVVVVFILRVSVVRFWL